MSQTKKINLHATVNGWAAAAIEVAEATRCFPKAEVRWKGRSQESDYCEITQKKTKNNEGDDDSKYAIACRKLQKVDGAFCSYGNMDSIDD